MQVPVEPGTDKNVCVTPGEWDVDDESEPHFDAEVVSSFFRKGLATVAAARHTEASRLSHQGILMAKAQINFNARFSSKQNKLMETKVKGKTQEFSVDDPDLDLDGRFVDATKWDGRLWDTIIDNESMLKSAKFPKPTSISSNLEEPGTYNLTVESDDQIFKGKIKISGPSKSDPDKRSIKRGTKPPHVKVQVKTSKLKSCPALDDLKDLVKQMGKTASYSYTGASGMGNGWTPKFNKHQTHMDPGTKGWKAYIDEPSMGTGTTWRLYFDLDFDLRTKTLLILLTDCKEDH